MSEETLPAVRLNAPLVRPNALVGALARVREGAAAIRRYAPTEARRNRVLYAGWPLIILGTMPFAAAIAVASDIPVGQAVSGALAAWAVAGLPITAVLFGAVSGAGLRGPAEDAEAPLPLSPRQRAFGALAAASAAFLGNAALVAALVAATSHDAGELLSGIASLGNWGSVAGYVGAMGAVAACSVAWLTTASFTAAYAASHAVLGGVAALVGGTLLMLPLGAGAALFINHAPELAMPFLAAAVASSAVSAGAAGLALAKTAPLAARSARLSWAKASLLSVLTLSGSLGAWPAFWNAGRAVKARLEQPWGGWDKKDSLQSQREKRLEGLMEGLGGRLVRETPAGTVVLLPGSDPALGELVRRGRGGFERVTRAFFDLDGRVWAEVRAPFVEGQATVRTIWTGDGKGPLTRYLTLPPDMELEVYGGRAAVDTSPYDYSDDSYILLDPAKPPLLKRQ
ncbi:hypothetical protein EPO15_00405 [bacterium]|nr:MAG: hypothetical protein EPO15_00405 [bacterium]